MSDEFVHHDQQPGTWGLVAVAWVLVSAPLLWGVFMTMKKAMLLFTD